MMSVEEGEGASGKKEEATQIVERRRSRRAPPSSLTEYAESRGYCSVTDLVSPSWCEYAFQYNTLGMSYLPVSERPEQIITPQGNIIKLNVDLAHQREKILIAGREVHKRLEKEIHPIRVHVETTTKEDMWGLRILQLVTGLKVLMDSGCCRELPVFGFVQGRLIFGVIDELKLHYDKPELGPKKQKYSSQEEWKRKAPQRKKQKTVDTSQISLAAFLPKPTNSQTESQTELSEKTHASQSYGFVLEDAKTRLSLSMPDEKDQSQSKLQCMLYKRILEGLIVGFADDLSGCVWDGHASIVDPEIMTEHLELDRRSLLSEEFMRDAKELCESFDFSLKYEVIDEYRYSCTLDHLFGILRQTMNEFVGMARQGANNRDHFSVIRNELRLTYRRREGRWSRRVDTSDTPTSSPHKRKSPRHQRKQPQHIDRNSDADIRKTFQNGATTGDLSEEAQVELALQLSIGELEKDDEEDKLADQSIPLPSPRRKRIKDFIIGTVKFEHNSKELEEHLVDVMSMWQGGRPLRGVTLEQTWRCNHCEYLNDCEWRQIKAKEKLQEARQRRKKVEDEAIWSQFDDDLPDDLEW